MDITLNGVTFRNGKFVSTPLNLTQRADGSWHATNFDKIMQDTHDASKSSASQSRNHDTYESEKPNRTELSDQEIADLVGKYDPNSMTQGQYDAFLDDLIEKGALSRFDAMRLGHHGWRILDINMGSFASGGIECGSARAASAGSDKPIQSLEDADGDLVRWLEHMLAQQNEGTREGQQRKEALNVLSDIIRRMRAG